MIPLRPARQILSKLLLCSLTLCCLTGYNELDAKNKAKVFYVSANKDAEAQPGEHTYYLSFKTEETATQMEACPRATVILEQILSSKHWTRTLDLNEAAALLEIEIFTIDRNISRKVEYRSSNAGAAVTNMGPAGPSGQMSTEARIGNNGVPVIVGKGAEHDGPETKVIENTVPEKHIIIRAYNLKEMSEENEASSFIVVDTVNSEERVTLDDCMSSLLQLACSYVGKQTDGYQVVKLKK